MPINFHPMNAHLDRAHVEAYNRIQECGYVPGAILVSRDGLRYKIVEVNLYISNPTKLTFVPGGAHDDYRFKIYAMVNRTLKDGSWGKRALQFGWVELKDCEVEND